MYHGRTVYWIGRTNSIDTDHRHCAYAGWNPQAIPEAAP